MPVDEVLEFCRRVLGSPEQAQAAAAQARANSAADRLAQLAHASRACRERAELAAGSPPAPDSAPPTGLSETVGLELEAANRRLPERYREALVLRELLGVSHDEIAAVTGLEATAVGPLLARARLRLRTELRGPLPPSAEVCAAQDRAVRLLARRQDTESVSGQDEGWLLDHLGTCELCERAHAAMLEASVCYRGWRAEDSAAAVR